jgi:hypothetical protein
MHANAQEFAQKIEEFNKNKHIKKTAQQKIHMEQYQNRKKTTQQYTERKRYSKTHHASYQHAGICHNNVFNNNKHINQPLPALLPHSFPESRKHHCNLL